MIICVYEALQTLVYQVMTLLSTIPVAVKVVTLMRKNICKNILESPV